VCLAPAAVMRNTSFSSAAKSMPALSVRGPPAVVTPIVGCVEVLCASVSFSSRVRLPVPVAVLEAALEPPNPSRADCGMVNLLHNRTHATK
jgi:hypothetical protein